MKPASKNRDELCDCQSVLSGSVKKNLRNEGSSLWQYYRKSNGCIIATASGGFHVYLHFRHFSLHLYTINYLMK